MTRRLMRVFILMSTMLAAHTVISQDFDMTRPATIKGQVAGVIFGPGNSYLLIDVSDASGKSQLWAVQGNALPQLAKDGWTPKGTVRPGDAISAVTFRPRSTAKVAESLPPTVDVRVLELAKTGHVLRGTEVTLPSGKKMPFGPSN
jgi:hypothetical protein